MLTGNFSNMRNNLDYLPVNHTESNIMTTETIILNNKPSELISCDIASINKEYEASGFNTINSHDHYVSFHEEKGEDQFSETDNEVMNFILTNIKRKQNGRLEIPLPWNSKNAHLLGKNHNISKKS